MPTELENRNKLSEMLIKNGTFMIQEEKLNDKTLRIVRDDFIVGGSKSRVLHKDLIDYAKGKELVYPATPFGYGQHALSAACKALNRNATIFGTKLAQRPELLTEALKNGANIQEIELGQSEDFNKVIEYAKRYAQADPENRAFLMPGFSDEDFIKKTAEAIMSIKEQLDKPVTQVWAVAGSGALSGALQQVWPDAEHCIVKVRHPQSQYGTDCNPRDASKVFTAPEAFEDIAKNPPPFPSSGNYEAKLWQFLQDNEEDVEDNALIWNM